MTDKQIIIDKNKFEKAENEPINQEAVNKFIEETDKFYVDGVDVSGCEYFSKGYCYCINHIVERMSENEFCKDNPNCHYKNWQRKEQECEQLKAELELFKTSNQTTIDQLKAENEQLKEELSVIQHNCNREGCKYYDDDTFKVFYECKAQKALQLSANSITTKYCDLLQTLAEIKEIINEFAKEDILTFPDFSKEQNYKLIQKQCGEPILKILQKIHRMNLSVEFDEAHSTATSLNEVKNVEGN